MALWLSTFALFSIVSAMTSASPWTSLAESKKLLLLLVPLAMVGTLNRRATMLNLTLVMLAAANLSAAFGIWQFFVGHSSDLQHRIQGFVGHYMTYAGLVMTSGVVALSGVLFSRTNKWLYAASLILIQSCLLLTLARNAWLGMVVAAVVLLAIKDRRLIFLVPVVASVLLLVQPDAVRYRVRSLLELDSSGRDRLVMIRAGMKMVAAHPWLGVGTDMVAPMYPIYVEPNAAKKSNPHLHNNAMQIAAERGLPTLIAWLCLVTLIAIESIRQIRAATQPDSKMLAATALGVLIAAVVAGTFEYNFGDSEYQMLFWFLVSFPFVLAHKRRQAAFTS